VTFAIRIRLFCSALGSVRCHTKVVLLLIAALFLTGKASAQTPCAPGAIKQTWTEGWDNFTEPLNFTHSHITWCVDSTTNTLTVTFKLHHATPSKLYQVGVHLFCTTFPATFGQFPNATPGGGPCPAITWQGVTKTVAAVEFGVVVTTDIHGNGFFTVAVKAIAPGTYNLEFDARNGEGCNLTGGGPNGAEICNADFQSPWHSDQNHNTLTPRRALRR
jgi:hypothetical protein